MNADVKIITLTNDFHNTSAVVRAKRKLDGTYTISSRVAKRVFSKLCGHPQCTCGDVCGCRPCQTEEAYDGEAMIIDT